ncbi:uncharacterized [Tachysurus ichikawai]
MVRVKNLLAGSELFGQEIHAIRCSATPAMIYGLTLQVHANPLTLYRYWPTVRKSRFPVNTIARSNLPPSCQQSWSLFIKDNNSLRLKVKAVIS